jgi:hypothetical protein
MLNSPRLLQAFWPQSGDVQMPRVRQPGQVKRQAAFGSAQDKPHSICQEAAR